MKITVVYRDGKEEVFENTKPLIIRDRCFEFGQGSKNIHIPQISVEKIIEEH